MGLHFRAKVTDFIDLLHVYPTMAEALKIVAISRFKDPRNCPAVPSEQAWRSTGWSLQNRSKRCPNEWQ
jgi:hypothetical protein